MVKQTQNDSTQEQLWQKKFEALKAFAAAGVDINCPFKDKKLNGWLKRQKDSYNRNELSRDRHNKLVAIGVILNKQEEAWDNRFEQLKLHATKHGNNVNHPISDLKLKSWVDVQKRRHNNGKLAADKVAALEAIGVKWSVSFVTRQNTRCLRALQALVRFKTASL